MRKSTIAIIVISAICSISWGISLNAQNTNGCLDCHGSADKLKTLIKDEDFNKTAGEGGYG
jgi:hypothetical protein